MKGGGCVGLCNADRIGTSSFRVRNHVKILTKASQMGMGEMVLGGKEKGSLINPAEMGGWSERECRQGGSTCQGEVGVPQGKERKRRMGNVTWKKSILGTAGGTEKA